MKDYKDYTIDELSNEIRELSERLETKKYTRGTNIEIKSEELWNTVTKNGKTYGQIIDGSDSVKVSIAKKETGLLLEKFKDEENERLGITELREKLSLVKQIYNEKQDMKACVKDEIVINC